MAPISISEFPDLPVQAWAETTDGCRADPPAASRDRSGRRMFQAAAGWKAGTKPHGPEIASEIRSGQHSVMERHGRLEPTGDPNPARRPWRKEDSGRRANRNDPAAGRTASPRSAL